MAALDEIRTIVILMLENRSFDHMLGHLSLEDPKWDVVGVPCGHDVMVDAPDRLVQILLAAAH